MLWWALQTASVAALLAAIVAAVCRLGPVSPAVKHALWLLVLIKLMTPPLAWYRLPRAVESRLARWTAPAHVDDGESAELLRRPEVVPYDAVDDEMTDAVRRADTGAAQIPPVGREFERFSFQTTGPATAPAVNDVADRAMPEVLQVRGLSLALVCWLAGAIPLAVVQLRQLVRLWQMMRPREFRQVPAWLDRRVRQLAGRLQIRPPQVVIVGAPCSPLVCALGRPRLLWPAELGEQLSDEARDAVLLHELAHLRRRDHWVAWLELAAGLVWWFNPLYWYVRHQLRENAELACDAWVVGLLPKGRRTYAQALIEVTKFVSLTPAAMPAVTMGHIARRTLERRLIMILRERTSYRVSLLGMGLIGLSLLAVLPSFSGGQDSGERKAAADPTLKGDANRVNPAFGNAPLNSPVAPAADTAANESVSSAGARAAAPAASGATAANPAAATPTAVPAVGDDADRIQKLETQLAKLLAEVQALRAGKPTSPQGDKSVEDPRGLFAGQLVRTQRALNKDRAARLDVLRQERIPRVDDPHRSYEVETLTRAKYKLPEVTAQALAAFIQEHVKGDVEARVSGDTLTVIASQEDQARIDGFIGLLGESARPAAGLPLAPPKANALLEGLRDELPRR